MEIFNAEHQNDLELNNLLQEIKYKTEQEPNSIASFPRLIIDGSKILYTESSATQSLLKKLMKMGVIEILARTNEEINSALEDNRTTKNTILFAENYLIRPIEPKFSRVCEKYEEKISKQLVVTKATTEINHKINKNTFPYKLPAGTKWENIIT